MLKGKLMVAGLVLALSAVVLTACSSSGGSTTAASGEITIRATEFKFEPASIKVTAGKPVTLILKNEGKVEHNIALAGVVSGKDVQIDAKAGETARVEFTPDKTGVHELSCTLPAHKDAGMVIKLDVTAG